MDFLKTVFILGLLNVMNIACIRAEQFNVLKYGAIGDGITDDSQAFLKAWSAACTAVGGSPTVVIPGRNKFLVKPVVFSGPCNVPVTFQVLGEIMAPDVTQAWNGLDQSKWIVFQGVTGLTFSGPGTINGRGKAWWDQNCRDHPSLQGCTSLAPTSINVLESKDVIISSLQFLDAPQVHILLMGCNSVLVERLVITAPGLSPNTDGIHIQSVQNLTIKNSKIGSGDDCISIGDYTSDIRINNIVCGPGHGISIGSLGRGANEVSVHNIGVSNVIFKGTTNGARIKTWQVGRGNVRHVTFENIKFDSVENPIIIDQNYCDRTSCSEQLTGVHISDVTFRNLVGTSASQLAVTLNCSRAVPCTEVLLDSINLTSNVTGKPLVTSAINVFGKLMGRIEPAFQLPSLIWD